MFIITEVLCSLYNSTYLVCIYTYITLILHVRIIPII